MVRSMVSARAKQCLALAVVLAATAQPAAAGEPTERARLSGHKYVTSLAISPDGKTLASAGAGRVKLWNIEAGRATFSLEANDTTAAGGAVAFSPDGKVLATSGLGKGIRLIDPAAGTEIKTIADQTRNEPLAFSPDGKFLATTKGTWDLSTGTLRHSAGDQFSVAYAPDGKTISLGGNSLALYEADTGKKIRELGSEGHALWAVAYLPDGKGVASFGLTSKVRLWDPATGKELDKLDKADSLESHGLGALPSLAVSPDGKLLAAGAKGEGVWLWDLASKKRIAVLKQASGPLAFGPDGKTFATGSEEGAILLWDLAGDKPATKSKEGVTRDLGSTSAFILALKADRVNDEPFQRKISVRRIEAALLLVSINVPIRIDHRIESVTCTSSSKSTVEVVDVLQGSPGQQDDSYVQSVTLLLKPVNTGQATIEVEIKYNAAKPQAARYECSITE